MKYITKANYLNMEAKLQTVTHSHYAFLDSLWRALANAGEECDVGSEQYLPIPLSILDSVTKDILEKKKGYQICISSRPYILRRPDVILLKYGLIIEFDGPVHDTRVHKIHSDEVRDSLYAALGFHTLRICNHQVWDDHSRSLLIKEILEFIQKYKSNAEKREYPARKLRVFRARRMLLKRDESLEPKITSLTFVEHIGAIQITEGKAWGGTIFRLRAKSKHSIN